MLSKTKDPKNLKAIHNFRVHLLKKPYDVKDQRS